MCKTVLDETYYECYPGYCQSLYGHYIQGDTDSVAIACAKDTKCKAFRHSAKLGFGYLCADTDARNNYHDWRLCAIDPGW